MSPWSRPIPPSRLRFMLEDSQVAVLVTTRSLASRLPGVAATLLCLDAEPLSGHSEADPAGGASPENLAYVIYTSGSTGQPKGVAGQPRQRGPAVRGDRSLVPLRPADVWTLFHSYAFDFSVWEMWGALLYGGRAGRRALLGQPLARARSASCCARERVTVLNQTPSAFRQLMEVAERRVVAGRSPCAWSSSAGKRSSCTRLAAVVRASRRPVSRLVNMYGITETTVHVTYRPLAAVEDVDGGGSRIGGPIPDLRLCVLDEHLQPRARRRRRRAVRRRRRRGPRLPAPARADGRALRPRSVQRPARAPGCTGRATWRADGPMETSSTWAGSTTR